MAANDLDPEDDEKIPPDKDFEAQYKRRVAGPLGAAFGNAAQDPYIFQPKPEPFNWADPHPFEPRWSSFESRASEPVYMNSPSGTGHFLYGSDLQAAAERMHPELRGPMATIPSANEPPTPLAVAAGAADLDRQAAAMQKHGPSQLAADLPNNTPLNPAEMDAYHKWARSIGKNPAQEEKDYDLRGYWKDVVMGNPDLPDRLRPQVTQMQEDYRSAPGKGHFPDMYKKPNHPTFSDESIYHGPALSGIQENIGGHWDEEKHTFTPGASNLEHWSRNQLRDYFAKHEPKYKIVLPGEP